MVGSEGPAERRKRKSTSEDYGNDIHFFLTPLLSSLTLVVLYSLHYLNRSSTFHLFFFSLLIVFQMLSLLILFGLVNTPKIFCLKNVCNYILPPPLCLFLFFEPPVLLRSLSKCVCGVCIYSAPYRPQVFPSNCEFLLDE